MVKISIVIPVYQVEDYIEACLNAIIAQQCEEAQIECILVDDCTPDSSMEIVNRVLEGYKGSIHFVVKHHDRNMGHCVARNTGIKVATGDYLLFVDSDDLLEPGAIHSFLKALKNLDGNTEVDVIMGNSYSYYCQEPVVKTTGNQPILYDNALSEEALRKLLNRELFHTSWNKLVRRDFFERYQLWFEPGIVNEDLLWSYQIFRHARKVLFLPDITYIYIDNPKSITRHADALADKIVRSRILTCNKILDNPPQHICQEYFFYLFFILIKAINTYEEHKGNGADYGAELHKTRNRLLRETWHNGYYIVWLFFLVSVKPFFYITRLHLFRRYYDRIAEATKQLSKLLH